MIKIILKHTFTLYLKLGTVRNRFREVARCRLLSSKIQKGRFWTLVSRPKLPFTKYSVNGSFGRDTRIQDWSPKSRFWIFDECKMHRATSLNRFLTVPAFKYSVKIWFKMILMMILDWYFPWSRDQNYQLTRISKDFVRKVQKSWKKKDSVPGCSQ